MDDKQQVRCSAFDPDPEVPGTWRQCEVLVTQREKRDKAAVRCKRHDALFRALRHGPCREPGCGLPVWSRGMCASHYHEWYREKNISREYFGHDGNRDSFVSLLTGIVEDLQPRLAVAVLDPDGFDMQYMTAVLALVRARLTIPQYNWIIRRLNDGNSTGLRLALWKDTYGEP